MLFPFGAACLWLFTSAAVGETHQAYGNLRRLLKYLFLAGVLTVLFTFILYLPVIIIGTGINSLVGNPFVTPLSYADLWLKLGEQLKSTWMNWIYDLPQTIQFLLAAGVILSLGFHHRVSQIKIPLQITMFIWILGMLVLLRRNPLDRIWLFLMPFWLIWAYGGLIAPLKHFKLPWKRLRLGLVIGSLVITTGWSIQRVHTYFPGWQADPGKIELTAEYLNQNLISGDAVAVIFPYDAPYWYYLKRSGVADEVMHQIELKTHNRVFAVVRQNTETIANVLRTHDLSPEEYQADEAKLVYRINDQEIYLCLHR